MCRALTNLHISDLCCSLELVISSLYFEKNVVVMHSLIRVGTLCTSIPFKFSSLSILVLSSMRFYFCCSSFSPLSVGCPRCAAVWPASLAACWFCCCLASIVSLFGYLCGIHTNGVTYSCSYFMCPLVIKQLNCGLLSQMGNLIINFIDCFLELSLLIFRCWRTLTRDTFWSNL